MRLTLAEQAAIQQSAKTAFPAGTRVSLFGSRTDEQRKGGDIDLLVETPGPLPPPTGLRDAANSLPTSTACWKSSA